MIDFCSVILLAKAFQKMEFNMKTTKNRLKCVIFREKKKLFVAAFSADIKIPLFAFDAALKYCRKI